jgi:hypothetical protein
MFIEFHGEFEYKNTEYLRRRSNFKFVIFKCLTLMLWIVAVCCVDFRKFVTPFLIMETKIEQYISELLYKHECVIVPQFGGFVARHLPASIN